MQISNILTEKCYLQKYFFGEFIKKLTFSRIWRFMSQQAKLENPSTFFPFFFLLKTCSIKQKEKKDE